MKIKLQNLSTIFKFIKLTQNFIAMLLIIKPKMKDKVCIQNCLLICCIPAGHFEVLTGIIEPPHVKTNNVVSEQVRHKPTCTSTEKS